MLLRTFLISRATATRNPHHRKCHDRFPLAMLRQRWGTVETQGTCLNSFGTTSVFGLQFDRSCVKPQGCFEFLVGKDGNMSRVHVSLIARIKQHLKALLKSCHLLIAMFK